MPIVMYILGYGLDDLGFKSHQGQETPLSFKLKGKQYKYQMLPRKPPYLSPDPEHLTQQAQNLWKNGEHTSAEHTKIKYRLSYSPKSSRKHI
jgi:hypothetical protein